MQWAVQPMLNKLKSFLKLNPTPSSPSNQPSESIETSSKPEERLFNYEDDKHGSYNYNKWVYPDGSHTATADTMQLAVSLDIRDLLYQLVDKKKEVDNRINTIETRIDKLSEELKERIILFDDEDKK